MQRPPKGDMYLKEKILRQSVLKWTNPFIKESSSRLHIGFHRHARKTMYCVGRLVYFLFVEQFDLEDPTLAIVPKNGDNLDTRFNNLQLIKKSELQLRTYREQRRKRPVKQVSQYDINGNHIKTYPSIVQAARETGYSAHYISQTLNGNCAHCFGFLWKSGAKNKIRAVKFPYKHVRRIAQYTPESKLVATYFSIREAERITGYDDIGIRDTAKGRRATYKGYIWEYVD